MNITIIGSGNLGTTLFYAFQNHTDYQVRIWGREMKSVSHIDDSMDVTFGQKNIQEVIQKADLIIISVLDDAVDKVSLQIPKSDRYLVCHTSGASSIELLENHKRKGIFYPLYSFPNPTNQFERTTPLLLSADYDTDREILLDLASKISDNIHFADDQERLRYHTSAVFSNNFGNHMLSLAYQILNDDNLEKEVLLPIIKQSCENWANGKALQIQSGPAIRDDQKTMEKHLQLLEDEELTREIYMLISKSIQNMYKK